MPSTKHWLDAYKQYGWSLAYREFRRLLQGLWEADLHAVRAVVEKHPEAVDGYAVVSTAAAPPSHWHPGQGGDVPPDVARDEQRASVVRYLVRKGADPEGATHRKVQPLHMAARYGLFETAMALLQCGAAVDAVDVTGQTPLHRATRYGYREVAQLLISAGASPTAADKRGVTPRQIARERGRKWPELGRG